MERANAVRGLRIAWTGWWGVVCLLLVVLWVRSYWVSDGFKGSLGKWYCEGFSEPGEAILGAYPSGYKAVWSTDSAPATKSKSSHAGLQFGTFGVVAFVPFRFTALITLALTVAPFIPSKQYSLRTLLIATTLIAVVLGIVVWSIRS